MVQQKALVLPEKSGIFEMRTVEGYKPGPGELLVKIMATALNPVDWKVQKYGWLVEKYPAILGSDSAGIVEEVGESVTAFKKGDKVFHQGHLVNDKATFQQYTIVPAEIVAKIPDIYTFDTIASVPLGLGTAAVGLYNPVDKDGAGLTPPWEPSGEGKYKGQSIVIFGGASSVGQYAIQLAHLSGFYPIVATASPHSALTLRSLGATHVLDRKGDVVSGVREILSAPPRIVFDAISLDATQEQAWKVLAPHGTLVLVLPARADIKDGEDGKRRFTLFGDVHVQRDLGRSIFAKLTELLQSGKIKGSTPNFVEVLPGGLAAIPEGLARLEKNAVSGRKLVVRPQETA